MLFVAIFVKKASVLSVLFTKCVAVAFRNAVLSLNLFDYLL